MFFKCDGGFAHNRLHFLRGPQTYVPSLCNKTDDKSAYLCSHREICCWDVDSFWGVSTGGCRSQPAKAPSSPASPSQSSSSALSASSAPSIASRTTVVPVTAAPFQGKAQTGSDTSAIPPSPVSTLGPPKDRHRVKREAPQGVCKTQENKGVPDFCPDIEGIQQEDDGYAKDSEGKCHVDKCLNVPGLQTEVPAHRRIGNRKSICVLRDLTALFSPAGEEEIARRNAEVDENSIHFEPDFCPEIKGFQRKGGRYTKDKDGKCHLDKCSNLPGIQTEFPSDAVIVWDAFGAPRCTFIKPMPLHLFDPPKPVSNP